MKKLAIISTGYMWFPCESGTVRMYDLAESFVKAGYEVDTIVPDFQHHQKAPRQTEKILSQDYPVQILFAKALPYTKNISFARIKSNKVLEQSLLSILESRIEDYDAVIVSIPPNNIAGKVVTLCKEKGIPCLVDIEDLWPEAMSMVIKNDFIRNTLLRGFIRDAELAYENCDAVVGTSPDYTARAFKRRKRDIPARTVYVGCDLETFDNGVEAHCNEIIKPENEFWVTYAGSISNSYDIESLVKAGELMQDEGIANIAIQILGTGTNLETLKNYAKEKNIKNIIFRGFVPYPKMAAFLNSSDILINSFVKGAVQSIVNKVGDYLAAGKPMINTLENPVFCSLVYDHRVGINVEPGNPLALKNAILSLYNDRDTMLEMGQNARRLCCDKFDRKNCNREIIEMVDSLISKKSKAGNKL